MYLVDLLSSQKAPLVVAAAVAALRVLYAIISRIVRPYPRARAAVETVAALSPDLLRALLQLVAVITGRPAASLDRTQSDLDKKEWRDRAILAELQRDELARSIAKAETAAPPASPAPVPAEAPAERQSMVPERTSSPEVPPVVLGALVALALLTLTGCPKPPPVSHCTPLSSRCDDDRLQVCSPDQRWFGEHRCGAVLPGQHCAVREGIARCER
jgi:hypothetical protein